MDSRYLTHVKAGTAETLKEIHDWAKGGFGSSPTQKFANFLLTYVVQIS